MCHFNSGMGMRFPYCGSVTDMIYLHSKIGTTISDGGRKQGFQRRHVMLICGL